MTLEEYRLARNAWIRREYDNEIMKPVGMLGHWAWYVSKERKFKQLLESSGIKIPKLTD